eukprot:TRINITY_DN700_c0_g1_i3.p1 TRINITY_DN700_c0_g1~~TRINITY_DN700_c0_g1_i3.p1  ORF type:complete len:1000 (-),score=261.71 TRINITY_DN700_c0_g1_i3:30-3029(-)
MLLRASASTLFTNHSVISSKRISTSSRRLRKVVRQSYVTGKNEPKGLKHLSESFIDGTSAFYVEDMYQSWLEDPMSVHSSWASYFTSVESGVPPGEAFQGVPSSSQGFVPSGSSRNDGVNTPEFGIKVNELLRAYEVHGHKLANIDPLGLTKNEVPEELNLDNYNFTEEELSTPINMNLKISFRDNIKAVYNKTVPQLVEDLKREYCSTIGYEYMHIQGREECNFLRSKISEAYEMSTDDKHNLLDRLTWATLFEQYIGKKFLVKRFGLDGGEAFIPALKTLIDTSSTLGVESCVIGMAHRGRLNVLGNVLRKPLPQIFREFSEGTETSIGSGDVKYHLGTSCQRPTRNGKKINLSLVSNPSHLEAVNPVVEGKVRAKQIYAGDEKREKVMSILIHGDASYAGQGVVYESMTLSNLKSYSTGGTIHIIINNQIGFTTNPNDSRPGLYCTDVAKANEAPIFHVNGDDPEALCRVAEIASEYRQRFQKDVVIDIVCYRRFGHNELEVPGFTQPLMYQVIGKHPTTLDIYSEKLIKSGVVSEEQAQKYKDECLSILEQAFKDGPTYKPKDADWLESKWVGFKSPEQHALIKTTGVKKDILLELGEKLSGVPEGFNVHSTIKRMLKTRAKMFETGEGIDWATAEALAFGTLLKEGNYVRLAGQDVERGTFSHRHSVIHDQTTGDEFVPLNHIGASHPFDVSNSFLSEFGCLGYELGFSLESPNALICWEAQFGDFANGAQIIIDQFISAGETKWLRQCGLVMLLPHGFEGMGPEHSSARLERFLAMSDVDPDDVPDMEIESRQQIQMTNWQVVNITTPANYFHALRRQIHREFRKPLIVMSPKSLLRHPLAKSSLDQFDEAGNDTRFLRVIKEVDSDIVPENVNRVVFCSGKVYYDLYQEREKRGIKNVAIIRVEQLSPFPFDKVKLELERYPDAEITWCQEEPKNMGAFYHCYFHFRTLLKQEGKNRDVSYAGRKAAASPASGSSKVHEMEQQDLINQALSA